MSDDRQAVMGTSTFKHAYDPIGNRSTSVSNSTTWTYVANQLNQYTAITGLTAALYYDLDGNITNDGTYAYAWDDENRLAEIAPLSVGSTSRKLRFDYDYLSRRVRKVLYTRSGSAWVVNSTNAFFYDGWNLSAQVRVPVSGAWSTNCYVWGPDLSGSIHGAGGIGGLIAWSRRSDSKTYLYCHDANGNVTELLDATARFLTVPARYQADPFGRVTVTGNDAMTRTNNVFRFSTKYLDAETGQYYYGYRFYSPTLGRWLSRDPLDVAANGYQSLLNSPLVLVDPNGASEQYWPPGRNRPPVWLPPQPLVPDPRPTLPLPEHPAPGSCRAIIVCKPVIPGDYHCAVVIEDSSGNEYACRAEPSRTRYGSQSFLGGDAKTPSFCGRCCGRWGTIITQCGPFDRSFPDHGAKGSVSAVVGEGPAFCGARRCLVREMRNIERTCYRYWWGSPNSNTALFTALFRCGIPTTLPDGVRAPGFRAFDSQDRKCPPDKYYLSPQGW